MTWNDHDHRGQYADERHDHDLDYAERHQQAVTCLRAEVAGLRRQLDEALDRIGDLEKQTSQARQLQLEADLAAADLATSGYDRHGRGCQCPYCPPDEPEAEEYDPGPEVDDEGGMSEYQGWLP